ncbi:MAG TPA: hypothetical protein VNI82_00020 [Candidatus Nitrosotenuis sp.]|nr:hypothetical protein [Candidatus Nitrosotenuis sp.]
MPGFFDGMMRMVKGEPVFQPSDEGGENANVIRTTPTAKPHSNRTDGKIVPIVKITNIECNIHGASMELDANIENHSTETVFLDKILILNRKWELDRDIKPGEEREFSVYEGPRPQNTQLTRCELHYRNSVGDYFSAIHFVEFRQLQDGMYVVSEIRFLPPVKDI